MTRRDWLLLFISFEGAPSGLDPVRLQKGMFLFSMEASDVAGAQKYEFRPYNYGPMSSGIYKDVDRLAADGLIEEVPVEGQSWSRYKASLRGIESAHKLMKQAMHQHSADTKHLYEIKQAVASAGFDALLEDVYDRYPEFAAKSVFVRR